MALLIVVELVENSLDYFQGITDQHVLRAEGEILISCRLNNLDASERSEDAAVVFKLGPNFLDDFLSAFLEVGNVEVEVNQVPEVERLVLHLFLDLLQQFRQLVLGGVRFDVRLSKLPHPKQHVQNFKL